MLSIVLVNYKSAGLLQNCLRSINQYSNPFEIIIVDNSNGDGAQEIITTEFPSVKWIDMGYNAGFARANNRAIPECHGDAILFLNPDTIIIDDAINKCYKKFSADKYIACGVQLLNEDGTSQISGNFAVKGGLNYLMMIPYVGEWIRTLGLTLGMRKPNVKDTTPETQEVDWINGAYLMVKKFAIDEAGAFDEDFFLYHEESEWCSRLKKVGALCVYGNFQIYHLEGQSSNSAFQSSSTGHSYLSDKKGYQLFLSLLVRLRKEFGVLWLLFHLLFHLASMPVIICCYLINVLMRPKRFNQLSKMVWGYIYNYGRCLRFIVHILSNKPYLYKVL